MTRTLKNLPLLLFVYALLVCGCAEKRHPVRIEQYTDPSSITGIAPDGDTVYCASRGGLVIWKLSERMYDVLTTADGLPSNVLSDVVIAPDGRVWVGSDAGVGVSDGSVFRRYGLSSGLPSLDIHDLALDNDGGVWAATSRGVASFNDGRFEHVDDPRGPGERHINAVFIDRAGFVWAGTLNDGIFSRDPKTGDWSHTTAKDGIIGNSSVAIGQAWDNAIWTASANGMARWNGMVWKTYIDLGVLGSIDIRDIRGTKNRLWFFNSVGVRSMIGEEILAFTEDDGLLSDNVLCGYVVSDDEVYVGTEYGLSVIRDGGVGNYTIPDTHHGNNCISLSTDDGGRLWLGTWESGLNILRDGVWTMLTPDLDPGLTSTVRSIVFRPDGGRVFNTTGGCVFQSGATFERQSRTDGLAGDDVRCGVYDNDNRYWVGTSTGISLYSRGKWKRFREVNGLPSEDVWSCAIDSRGTVWFGTTGGIVAVEDNAIVDKSGEVGLDDLDVRSMLAMGDMLYIGTADGRLASWDGDTWNVYGSAFLGTDKGIFAMAAEPSGTLWLGTNGDGVIRVGKKSTMRYTRLDGIPSDFVRSLAYHDGRIWAACYGGVGALEPLVQ